MPGMFGIPLRAVAMGWIRLRVDWLAPLLALVVMSGAIASDLHWESVGPPGVVSPSVVTTDPAWPDRVYVASPKQVYASLDGGRHFFATPGEVVGPYVYNSVTDLAVLRRYGEPAPNTPPRILVATYNGLRLSTNGGASYTSSTVGDPSEVAVHQIYPTPDNDTVVYLNATGGTYLYRSADGGAAWQRVALPEPTYVSDLAVISQDGNVLALATRNGIFKSTDAGSSWMRLASGLPTPPYTAPSESLELRLVSDPSRPLSLYLVLPNHGVYRSNDGGGNWLQATPQVPGIGAARSLIASGDSLWLLTQQLDRSTDGGRTWHTLFPASGRPASPYSIARDARTGRLHLLANAGGGIRLWRSDDEGDTWELSGSGLNAEYVSHILPDPTGAIYALTTSYAPALLKTDDGGRTWRDAGPPSCAIWRREFNSPASVVVFGSGQLVADCITSTSAHRYRASADGGATWQVLSEGTIGLLAVEPGSPGTLYGKLEFSGPPIPGTGGFSPTFDMLHASDDGGRTWRSIHAGLPERIEKGRLVVHAGGGGRLLVSLTWFSGDRGASWQRNDLPDGAGSSGSTLRRPEVVVAVVGNQLYRSEDAGRHFAPIGTLPSGAAPATSFTSVPQILLDPNADRTLHFVDPWGQVFVTTDDGRTWSSLGRPLRNGATILNATMSTSSAKTIYAATDVASVMKFVASDGLETAIEFYHATFDHYFVTAEPDEATWLSLGNLPPWVPTGEAWPVWTRGVVGSLPVCRFFSAAFAPKSSHFYTPYAAECTYLKQQGVWLYEEDSFGLELPIGPADQGSCRPATQPLYRAYNNGQGGAPNHRYTTDPAILDAMVAQGWIMEGEAATRVFACVPAP